MIDRDTIDRIYAAANIVDIVNDYVTLKRRGANYMACCPFHNEKTPSFVVSPAKGLFKCFGCGKAGNAVTFVREMEQISYPDALKRVARRYGIEVKEREMTPEEAQRNDNRESMFTLNSWASDYFAEYLHDNEEGVSVGMSYFRQARGFTAATIKKFGLGFCSSRGDAMTAAARAAGYKEEFLLSTGLSIKRERDGRLFDRFHDRVIFPVHNISGRIVAFGGRTLRTDKSVAKYQNSPESEIYSKKNELYGLFFAKKAIQQMDCAIMVEGYTDVISMHQAGVENVVASSGTSLTTEQVRLLSRFTHNITIIYDGDSAGIHASLRGIDLVLKEGMNVRIVLLPPEHDPDSFARSRSASEVQEFVRANEEDFITFKAKLLLSEAKNDPIRKSELITDIVTSIVQVPEPIKRSVYTKECARIMDIDEKVLLSEVARRRMRAAGGSDRETDEFLRRQQTLAAADAKPRKAVDAGSSMEALEREILRYLLKYGHCSFDYCEGHDVFEMNVAQEIFRDIDSDGLHFSNKTYDTILDIYREQWQRLGVGQEVPASCFIGSDNAEVCNVSVDLFTSGDNYTPSKIWQQKDIHVESEREILSAGVPKAIALYKSKVIESLIGDLSRRLSDPATGEAAQTEIITQLSRLNNAKVALARRLQRLIL